MLHRQHRTQIQVGLGPPTDHGYGSICHHPSKLLLSLLGRLSWDWPLREKADHWGVKMRNFTELREKIIMKEEEGKGDALLKPCFQWGGRELEGTFDLISRKVRRD